MRQMSPEAQELLSAAASIARFRGAQACDRSDIEVAVLLLSLHPGVALYADATQNTSPQQLPMSPAFQDLLTDSGDDLGLDELRRFAADL